MPQEPPFRGGVKKVATVGASSPRRRRSSDRTDLQQGLVVKDMDFAQALHELSRRKGLVALGIVLALFVALSTAYDFQGVPPKLHKKTLALGTGSAALLVDTPNSSVTNLQADLQPLAQRAVILARLATSEKVREAIARNAGLQPSQLNIEAPIDGAIRPQAQRETRVASIVSSDASFKVDFLAREGLPTIAVNTQAPHVADARRLADLSAGTFRRYISAVQTRQGRSQTNRVVLRQLGPAEGGTVAKQINKQLVILAFLAAFVAWCLLVLVGTGVARNLREIRQAEHTTPLDEANEPA